MKKLRKISILGGISVFAMLTVIFFASPSYAEDCSDNCKTKCANYIDPEEFEDCKDDCEDECNKLDKKARVIKQNLKINEQTQNLITNQLEYINKQQSTNLQKLTTIQNKLGTIAQRISDLERDIIEKERLIAYQKKILTGLMQSYYEYDQQGVLELVLWNRDLSVSMNQSDYLEQSGVKVTDTLQEIKDNQKKLSENKRELEGSRNENEKLKDQLQYEKSNLESTENQKTWLLQKTQGEEQKYQEMLAHIEEQKKELFDFASASNLGEIMASVKNYPKPDKKDWAPVSWFFRQTDSRWANQRIGNSSSLMKDWGCAVTSVAMVFRKLGSSIDPGKLAKEKIFYTDLIKWPSSWTPSITLASSVSHGNVNWSTIKNSLDSDNPVIAYIKKNNGGGGHYVVITGKDKKDYIVHDPYFGSNLYLETSKALIGKLGTDSSVRIDQMIIYK
jgi:peptidoglycan hydrolase CwlO-like protein